MARAAVVPGAPTRSKPISSRISATLSPIAGVGARDRSMMPNGIFRRLEASWAVSYTHLDVYKRQGLARLYSIKVSYAIVVFKSDKQYFAVHPKYCLLLFYLRKNIKSCLHCLVRHSTCEAFMRLCRHL